MTDVLVVDDSQFMRTVIGNALEEGGYAVETAADGASAVDAAAAVDPDVVTMDVEMPGMDGIEAVERIMATAPAPTVMLSAYTADGADATLDALERGAVDFIHKPDGSDSRNLAHLVDSVVETVDELAAADVSSLALAEASSSARSAPSRLVPAGAAGESATTIERPAGSSPADGRTGRGARVDADQFVDRPTLVIGASTGGPRLIERVLAELPLALEAKVIVVQHMPPDFTARFADRLDRISAYRVREARDGDRVEAGDVAVARGGTHLAVTNNVGGWLRVRHEDGARIHGVRPAIDVTMRTAADRVSDPLVGVVLTGMGKDGAAGIEAISRAGGRTIAQDEATSPVFGIPKQAIQTGCVDEVAPADDLVDRICEAFSTDGETNG